MRVPGSSIALRSALAADSVSRSASSMTTTRQPPIDGAHATRVRSSRTSSTLMERPSVRMISTSGWPWVFAELQSLQVPQPFLGQMSAWANATAADERPDPGGPVKTQAWVISWLSSWVRDAATALVRMSMMCSWPTRSSKTEDIYFLILFVTACVAVRIGLRNLFCCGPCALRLSAGSSATRAMICVWISSMGCVPSTTK